MKRSTQRLIIILVIIAMILAVLYRKYGSTSTPAKEQPTEDTRQRKVTFNEQDEVRTYQPIEDDDMELLA